MSRGRFQRAIPDSCDSCKGEMPEVWMWTYSRVFGWEALCTGCSRAMWGAIALGNYLLQRRRSDPDAEALFQRFTGRPSGDKLQP